jgi:hypothetical protein
MRFFLMNLLRPSSAIIIIFAVCCISQASIFVKKTLSTSLENDPGEIHSKSVDYLDVCLILALT